MNNKSSSGIVKVPVVTVFAIEDPDIKPVIPEPRIAALAGPPLILPTIAKAKSKKYFPPPAHQVFEDYN